MASIRELKEALAAERAASVEASHTAIAAIDTLLNFSMWVMAILAIAIAIVALFGYRAIRGYAAKVAKDRANEEAASYVASEEFLRLVEETVAREVQKRWAATVVVGLDSSPASSGTASVFDRLGGNDDDPR